MVNQIFETSSLPLDLTVQAVVDMKLYEPSSTSSERDGTTSEPKVHRWGVNKSRCVTSLTKVTGAGTDIYVPSVRTRATMKPRSA